MTGPRAVGFPPDVRTYQFVQLIVALNRTEFDAGFAVEAPPNRTPRL
jgi:hypothetical protein